MSHTIVMLLVVLIGLTACEIHPLGTQAKLQALQRAQRHGKHRVVHHHKAVSSQPSAYVSPQWLDTYRSLEAEHGDYTIPDDHKIQVSQDGKIRVPTTVIRHFNDLSKAPTQPTP